jgi:predicted nucleotidyltransferase component of viral defense system
MAKKEIDSCLTKEEIAEIFERVPALKDVGVFTGANALYQEHLPNRFGRGSMDLDFVTDGEVSAAREKLHGSPLKLVSRRGDFLLHYEMRLSNKRIGRVDVGVPYLKARQAPVASKHFPGVKVLSLPDMLFAKVSALSTRNLPRDLFDLFAAGLEKNINWKKLLSQAGKADDNDYNPQSLDRNLRDQGDDLDKGRFQEVLTVRKMPPEDALKSFIRTLAAANAELTEEVASTAAKVPRLPASLPTTAPAMARAGGRTR